MIRIRQYYVKITDSYEKFVKINKSLIGFRYKIYEILDT